MTKFATFVARRRLHLLGQKTLLFIGVRPFEVLSQLLDFRNLLAGLEVHGKSFILKLRQLGWKLLLVQVLFFVNSPKASTIKVHSVRILLVSFLSLHKELIATTGGDIGLR